MSNKKARNKEILKQLSAESEGLNKLHVELFPEEYDYIYDDAIDTARRKQGINPMRLEYQERVNQRRLDMGVLPFGEKESEDSKLISSWEYCKRKLSDVSR